MEIKFVHFLSIVISLFMPKNSKNKKIAFFVPSLNGGGAERVMLILANKFSENDFRIDLILAKKEGPYLSEVGPKVNIVDLKSSNVPQGLFPLIKYLKKEKPDVLISTLAHANVVAVLAKILSRTKTKIIARVTNTFSEALKNNTFFIKIILFFGVSIFYRFADEIVAGSEGAADDLSKTIKISRNKIRVICNPTDVEKIRKECEEIPNHPWLKNKTMPVILAAGRLTVEKDYPTLFKAFSILSEKNNFRLIILGEGKKRGELEELVEMLRLQDKINMPGFVKNPFSYMCRCDVFVLSSITEGLPNTLIEAMACGTPVVSTDCPSGPREILDNGRFGRLVEVGNEKELSRAILETLKNPPNPTELKNRVEKKFSLENTVEKYLNIIKKYSDI